MKKKQEWIKLAIFTAVLLGSALYFTKKSDDIVTVYVEQHYDELKESYQKTDYKQEYYEYLYGINYESINELIHVKVDDELQMHTISTKPDAFQASQGPSFTVTIPKSNIQYFVKIFMGAFQKNLLSMYSLIIGVVSILRIRKWFYTKAYAFIAAMFILYLVVLPAAYIYDWNMADQVNNIMGSSVISIVSIIVTLIGIGQSRISQVIKEMHQPEDKVEEPVILCEINDFSIPKEEPEPDRLSMCIQAGLAIGYVILSAKKERKKIRKTKQ